MAKINIANGIISSSADYGLYRGTSKIVNIQDGEFRVLGDLIAENYIISSSVSNIEYQSLSGSTIFGDSADDTHVLSGSVTIKSPSGDALILDDNNNGANKLSWAYNGTSQYYMRRLHTDGEFYISSNGSGGAVNITGDSNHGNMPVHIGYRLGIGNTGPAAKLHVSSNSDSSEAFVIIEDTDTTAGSQIPQIEWRGNTATFGFFRYTKDGAFFRSAAESNLMHVSGSGQVGIGTTNPQSKLDIVEVYSAGTSVQENLQLLIRGGESDLDPVGSSIGMGFGYGSANDYVKTGIINEFVDANGRAKLHLATSNVSGTDTINKGDARLTILQTGEVGIGTVSPSNKLTVEDTIGIKRSGVNAITTLQMAGSGLIVNGANGYHPLIVQANGTEIFRVKNDGNISGSATSTGSFGHGFIADKLGIGTTSPVYALVVNAGNDMTAQFKNDADRARLMLSDNDTDGFLVVQNSKMSVGLNNSVHANNLTLLDGQVGIGTTSPTQKLHIGSRGTASDPATTASDGLVFDFYNAGNPYPRKGSIISNSADASESKLAFWTAAASSTITEKMSILGNGNVGIGTTSPSTMLHLKSSAGSKPKLTIEDTNADDNMGALQFIKDSASPSTGDKLMQIWAYGDNNAAEQILYSEIATLPTSVTDGSEEGSMRFRVQSGGSFVETMRVRGSKVGIGTDSPAAKLEIQGANGTVSGTPETDADELVIRNNSDAGINILAGEGSGDTSGIVFGSTSDINGANIHYNYNDKLFRIGTQHASGILTLRSGNGAEAIRILANGKVGIGVTSPGDKLTVQGGNIQVTGSGGIGIKFVGTADGSNKNALYFRTQGGTEKYRMIHDQSADGTDDIVFKAAANSITTLALKQDGKVGIGTSTPGFDLEIADNGTNSQTTMAVTGYNDQTGYRPEIQLRKSNSDTLGGVSATPDGTQLGMIRFRGVDSGNGFDDGVIITATQNGSANTKVPTDLKFETSADTATNSNQLFLHHDGYVGIGTDSPDAPLHILGDGGASDPLATMILSSTTNHGGLVVNAPASKQTHIRFQNNGTLKWQMRSPFHDSTNPDSLRFYSMTKGADVVTLLNDGKVGIGTVSPTAPLHIFANSSDTQNLFFDNDGTGKVGVTLRSDQATDGNVHGFIFFDGADSAGNNTRYNTIESIVQDNTNGTEDGRLTFSNMGNGILTSSLSLVSGNVGVGVITTPSYQLHVFQHENAASEFKTLLSLDRGWDGGSGVSTDRISGMIWEDNNSVQAGIFANRYASNSNYKSKLQFYVNSGNSSNMTPSTALGDPSMTLSENGYLGIGTISPAQALDISGSLYVHEMTKDALIRVYANGDFAGGTRTAGIVFGGRNGSNEDSTSDYRAGMFSRYNGDLWITATSGTGVIGTPASSASIYIEGSNKRVGIGTTAPDELLHIKQTGNDFTTIKVESTANHANAASAIQLVSNDGSIWFVNHSTSRTTTRYGTVLDGYGEILAQDSNGGLVIGTGTADKEIIFGVNDKEQLKITDNSISGSATSTGSFGALHIPGRVGIGTTSQNSNLTIQTTANSFDVAAATGTLQFGSTSATPIPSIAGRQTAGTHGLVLMSLGLDGTTTGDMIFDTRENNNSTFATTANAGFKFQHYANDLVTILRNGKVGIGVADPDSMLEVVGGSGATSINAHGVVKFRTTSVDGSELRHQFNMGGASDPGSYSIYQGNASTIGVNLAAGDVSYFNGGNVGIGTASPAYDLDVDGNIRYTTSLLSTGVNTYIRQQYKVVSKEESVTFSHGTAHQKVDFYFTALFWGTLKMTITGTYSNQNMSGLLEKTFYLGLNINNAIYTNSARYSEVGGQTAENFAISDLTWDSTNSRYKITVAHRNSNGNVIRVNFRAFAGSGVDTITGISHGDVYTSDTSVPDEPFVNLLDQGTAQGPQKIGIGTDSPVRMLDIVGAGAAIKVDSSDNAYIELDRGAASNLSQVRYLTAGSAKWYAGLTDSDVSGFDGTEFFIGEGSGGASDAHFVIDGSGNIGIGTTSPTHKLNVYNDGGASSMTVGKYASGKTVGFLGTSADTSGYFQIQSYKSQGSTFGDIVLNAQGGNVGIGTTSPGQGQSTPISDVKFDVLGNQMLSDLSTTNTDQSKLFFFRSDGAVASQGVVPDGLKIGAIEWAALTSGDNNNSISSARIEVEASNTWSSAAVRNADIIFSTVGANALAERLRITSAGYVGIGTDSPGQELEVIGVISASSHVYAGDRVYVNGDITLSHDGSSQLSVGFDATYDKIRYGKSDNVVHEFLGQSTVISGSATSTGSFGMLSLNNGGAQIASGYTLNVKGHMTGSSLSVSDGLTLRDGALSIYNGGAQVIQLRHDNDQELIFRNGNNAKNKLVLTDTAISGSASSTGSFGTINLNGNQNARPLFVREGNNAVGMGTSSPTATRLHAYSGTATNTGLVKFEAGENGVDSGDVILILDFSADSSINSNNDYIQFQDAGGEVGRIHSEVSYGTFTGTHVSQRPSGSSYDDWKPGMIVKSTGNILATGSSMALAWPEVELTTTQKDKAVMGVWEANNPSGSHNDKYLDRTLPRINYNAVGEGKIRVTDTGGNIETGDYICSSTRTGHGEKQDDDLLHNYTVAKATQPYNFASASNDSDLGYKSVLIACTYHCG